jgi:hypothetical protein
MDFDHKEKDFNHQWHRHVDPELVTASLYVLVCEITILPSKSLAKH